MESENLFTRGHLLKLCNTINVLKLTHLTFYDHLERSNLTSYVTALRCRYQKDILYFHFTSICIRNQVLKLFMWMLLIDNRNECKSSIKQKRTVPWNYAKITNTLQIHSRKKIENPKCSKTWNKRSLCEKVGNSCLNRFAHRYARLNKICPVI